ncbi:MAG: class I SAM-dependent methyltransferase [Planctomycetota bacterium]
MSPSDVDVSKLKAGDHHYMAYVGPPTHYDFMGATQFRLLCSLGLRAEHKLLDFGCGSLRAGRFLIAYLNKGHYCGVEPNRWLIEEAIESRLGADFVRLNEPRFDHNEEFSVAAFGEKFDWIVAQSIFSHTGLDLTRCALRNFADALSDTGRVVATFVDGPSDHDGDGWIYPGCVTYREPAVAAFAREAGLHATRLPWFHPRQVWYVLAKRPELLPPPAMKRLLTGIVLFDPELSISARRQLPGSFAGRVRRALRELFPKQD